MDSTRRLARGFRAPMAAGRKRLALLRESVITSGMPGQRVLHAVCGPDAGARLADGSLWIAAPTCDALIDLCSCLPSTLQLVKPNGGDCGRAA